MSTSIPPKLAWSLQEIHQGTGLSVSFLRKEIRSKNLRAQNIGRRVLVLDEELRRYLSGHRQN